MNKKRLLELAGVLNEGLSDNDTDWPWKSSPTQAHASDTEMLDQIDKIVSGEQMLGAEPYNLQRKLALIKQVLDQR